MIYKDALHSIRNKSLNKLMNQRRDQESKLYPTKGRHHVIWFYK